MQTSDKEFKPEAIGKISKILSLIILVLGMMLLQACSGTSTPSYPASTTNDPAPGITLQAIKITPAASLISLAENRQLVAVGVYSDGTTADVSSQVTWSASSAPNTTNNVAVTSKGLATGMSIGLAVVTASVGTVTGLIQLTVDTNGYTSSTTGILSVPYKSAVVDAAYLAQSGTTTQGAYAVQEVNLDADAFSNVLPVPQALLASIPMPGGFVPNATAANQSNALVAVISYTSPNVQIIDASNLSTDLNNNLVIATFKAPVTQTVTVNGISCMICAAVVNPSTSQLVLGTSQGFYSMDMVAGTFTAIPFTPTPAPSANFSIVPNAGSPYILSASPATGEVQILDLTTNAVTTINSGLTSPATVATNLLVDYAAVLDSATNNLSIVDLTSAPNSQFNVASNVSVCAGSTAPLNMAAFGISAAPIPSSAAQVLLTTQTGGNCVGVQLWPAPETITGEIQPSNVLYGYGSLPVTPDGSAFVNGTDPNAIATFNDVLSGSHTNYGLLVDANQQWIARVNFGTVLANANIGPGNGNATLPTGQILGPFDLCAAGPGDVCSASSNSITYLPTPSAAVTVSVASINFGSVSVGTPTPPISVIEANIGPTELNNQPSVVGPNAGDFTLSYTCGLTILPHSNCTIGVSFTPSTTGSESATLSIAVGGAATPLTVALIGTGI